MLDNQAFFNIIQTSFKEFVKCGTSRSTAKLKPLHGAIAADIAARLGQTYRIWSQGFLNDHEQKIDGRYIGKMVDIAIEDLHTHRMVGGIGVKFVMQNYSQNSNNYFENMLGETANIRAAHCPYFQIFIILDKLPYYQRSGVLKKWETFTHRNVHKYSALAADNIDSFFHTPNKTLICVVHVLPEADGVHSKEEYMELYCRHLDDVTLIQSPNDYRELAKGGAVILNNYEQFADKIYHTIKSL